MLRLKSGVFLFLALSTLAGQCTLLKDSSYWAKLAAKELKDALNVKQNEKIAKNIILFLGSGMGPSTVTATRIYKGGESHKLSYENFPHMGMLKTYSGNKMVPDSASSATALLCGVKVNQYTVAVDASVQHRDCAASQNPRTHLESLATLALKAGKSAGFVTTRRVSHSSSSPLYAQSAARQWECDSSIPAEAQQCKDISRQLFEDFPGRDFQVIMGGGRQTLTPNVTGTTSDPLNRWTCSRLDGRDLFKDYAKDKEARNLKYSILSNNGDLKNLNADNTDYVLGIFANENMRYDSERDTGPDGMPSIRDMVEGAIKILKKNDNGYFLLVHGAMIDMAQHRGRAKQAIDESARLDDAVKLASELTDEEDTLIVVSSDHSAPLSINGYADRGGNIFGTVGPSRYDGKNFTVISYGTGGPGSLQQVVEIKDNIPTVVRQDPANVETDSFDYEQIAAITLDEVGHSGEDVTVYARGPFSHLFHRVHEQHYLFHAISHAANLGPARSKTEE